MSNHEHLRVSSCGEQRSAKQDNLCHARTLCKRYASCDTRKISRGYSCGMQRFDLVGSA